MSYVIEISQDQFIDEVVEKSKTIPVIVDFGRLGVVLVNS